MPTPKQQRRRALELLEASIDGCTEAIMLAYGFKTEVLVELVNAELATSTIGRMVISGRGVKVERHPMSLTKDRNRETAIRVRPNEAREPLAGLDRRENASWRPNEHVLASVGGTSSS